MTFVSVYCLTLLLVGTALAAPACTRMNDCACNATGTTPAGLVNLYPLVNKTTTKPMWMVNGTSQWVKDSYTFYYNPCGGFTMASTNGDDPCKGDLLCQHEWHYNQTYNLGVAGSVTFHYVGNILVAHYDSKGTDKRTADIMLLCDQNEPHGKLVFVNESKELYYQFNFSSMCACPGKCPNKTLVSDEWIQTDKCSYRNSISGKVINLQGLDTPLKVATGEHTTYYYNPCNGLELGNLDEKCKDVAVCKMDLSTFLPTYVASKEVKVTEDDGDIVLHYPATDFNVKLICDQSADEPMFVYAGNSKMILKAKEACPL